MCRLNSPKCLFTAIFSAAFLITSCRPLLTRVTDLTKEEYRPQAGQMQDSLHIASINILERRCDNCERRANFPLTMTNSYGNKNLEILYRFVERFNKEHTTKIILPDNHANDSLYYFSKQEWTRRIWGKKAAPKTTNGLALVISHSFRGSLSAGIDGGASGSGDIETVYEFIEVSFGKETNYISFRLTRGSSFNNQLIKYKDLSRIFTRLLLKTKFNSDRQLKKSIQ